MRSNEIVLNMGCFLLLMGIVRPDAKPAIKGYKEMIEKIGKEGLHPDSNPLNYSTSGDGLGDRIELVYLLGNELAQRDFSDLNTVAVTCELSSSTVAVPNHEQIPFMTTELVIMTDASRHTHDVCLYFNNSGDPPIMFKRKTGDGDWELSDLGTERGIDNRKEVKCFMRLAEAFSELRELKCDMTMKVTHERTLEIIIAFAKMATEYRASLLQQTMA